MWFDVSAAQEGVVRVFERAVEVAAEGDAVAGIDGVVSCRLLVHKNQGGAVIGKGGMVVEKIKKDTGCRVKVLAVETCFPGSSSMDEIVEIEGLGLAVKKALVAVTDRLQEFPPPETTRTYPIRPLDSESLPIQTVDLPLQRNPILQPTPSNYINHVWGGGAPSVSEKVSYTNSITPPQEVLFKLLCPNERVGGIMGMGGSIVQAIQNETGASVSVGLPLADCDERLITISAMESVESEFSPAQRATVAVFTRSMETGLVKGFGPDSRESRVSARVLVALNQVGCLLGKGGSIISEMRKVTSTSLWIIGDQVPKCASENEEVFQITGELANVQAALYKVTSRLRDHMLSTKMLTANRNRNFSRTENGAYGIARDRPAFGSHQSVADSDKTHEHKSLIQRMDHLAISNNKDRLLSPSSFTSMPGSGLNQGNIMATGGRLASVKGGVEIGSGSRAANIMTVEIVIPDAAIGSNSSDFDRLRLISGAKVVVQEPRPGTTQRTVVISGTPDETQAAQSLLQAFILPGS